MAPYGKPAEKSRRVQRKEARSAKKKKKFDSWIQHQQTRKLKKASSRSKSKKGKKSQNSFAQILKEKDDLMTHPNYGTDYRLEQPTSLKNSEAKLDSSEFPDSTELKIIKRKKGLEKRKKIESLGQDLKGEMAGDQVVGLSEPIGTFDERDCGTEKPQKLKKSKNKFDSLKDPNSTASKTVKRKKTNFEEYLEMDMQEGVVSVEEDLKLERKLAKKLKVKEGKLGGADDGINIFFEGIPSILDFSEDELKPGAEEAAQESLEKSSSRKKRKKMKSLEQESEVEIVGDTPTGVSEPVKTFGADAAMDGVPAKAPGLVATAMYVAPHLRSRCGGESEEVSQIRRRVRGLLNKLSESNVESIAGEISSIFRSVGRSVGSQIVSEEVLGSCSGGPRGNEQYAAVFAAFVAGMACLVGIDFGAKLLASLAKCFEDEFREEDNLSLRNLTLLLSYLYIFGVCSSELIYDFMIILSKRLTEIDVSTILTILQCCGMKLRGDDPTAMKNFIQSVQNRVNELKASSGNDQERLTSRRMEFMLETIFDIKNNKKRPKDDTEQHTRIKKWLQKLRVVDVLIRGLKWSKLLNPDKKGQWWLSGDTTSMTDDVEEVASTIDRETLEAQKMLQLAAAQRMNTDARKAIFCVIMSAEDYIDAFEKILRLDLQGKQDREIMRVLVECCLQEKVYNKYYSVLATKLCSHDKNHKFTLQYCLWDHFKELESMQLIRSMHLSKFVAEMVSSFTLSISFLKVIELGDTMQLSPKRIMHFRMLFEAIFEHSDSLIWNIFTRIAVTPEYESLRSGIEFFIKKYVVSGEESLEKKFKVAKKALNNLKRVVM
ncbi:uncharacterized protein LOC132293158 [Cornus florida]|uniref:uncharacterized protein LOC132293158 n=1 Tax=Cornus florida TaxID=4283 RepID=UPI0028A12640|nr:uncharacterized protein LOC132293158 [Cornus florida]